MNPSVIQKVYTKPGERQAGYAFIIILKYSVVSANLFAPLLAGGDRLALVSEVAGIAAVANALLTHGKLGEKPKCFSSLWLRLA